MLIGAIEWTDLFGTRRPGRVARMPFCAPEFPVLRTQRDHGGVTAIGRNGVISRQPDRKRRSTLQGRNCGQYSGLRMARFSAVP